MKGTTGSTLELPASAGGQAVRADYLPVSRPHVGEHEIAAVTATLRSLWLVTGRQAAAFEQRFAAYVGQAHGVALTSGTAAIELALELAGVGPGDEVITTPLTFVATAHAVLHRGAKPVFADVDRRTWNIDPAAVEAALGPRTRALLLVHFAGRACAMPELAALAERHGLTLVSDSAHSIETLCRGRKLAEWFPLNAFSFHPTKTMTTGEGGMLTTDDEAWADRLRSLRLHGLSREAWGRDRSGAAPALDVERLGYKCNMSDIQASLGLAQLDAIDERLRHRERLWARYDELLRGVECVATPAPVAAGDRHARHIYTVFVDFTQLDVARGELCAALHAENVGTGHHYPALHRTRYYRERFGLAPGELPEASRLAAGSVTLPLHAGMDLDDVASVVRAVEKIVRHHRR